MIRALARRFLGWLGPREMNVNVRIEQTINTEGDPERVLVMTRKALEDALKDPLANFRRVVLPEDLPDPPPTSPPVEP